MDDNTNECPNCGAKVYLEMTRCPECGHNMYPEDEEASPVTDDNDRATGWSVAGAVIIGWMITCGLALLTHFIVAQFQTPSTLGVSGKVVLWLSGPVGAIVGGYVAGGIALRQSRWIGMVAVVFALPAMVLFATHWEEVTLNFLSNPWVLGNGAATLATGALGGWLNYKFSQDTQWKEKWQVRGWEDLLYQDLLRKVRFNGSAADRLIDYERQQDPQASRLKLIQNAIERWERDNR